MLYDDPVFEDILIKERSLTLIYYLLGESAKLSSIGCHIKGPGEAGEISLHADDPGGTNPLPTSGLVANVNYALVPYSREGGATAVVPASHHWCRQPTPRETRLGGEHANPHAIPVDLSSGDCVVWHGSLWHGSFARTIPGLRLNLACFFRALQPYDPRTASGPSAAGGSRSPRRRPPVRQAAGPARVQRLGPRGPQPQTSGKGASRPLRLRPLVSKRIDPPRAARLLPATGVHRGRPHSRYPGPFAKLSDSPIRYRLRAPRLDEHRSQILEELARRAPEPAGGRAAAAGKRPTVTVRGTASSPRVGTRVGMRCRRRRHGERKRVGKTC